MHLNRDKAPTISLAKYGSKFWNNIYTHIIGVTFIIKDKCQGLVLTLKSSETTEMQHETPRL